MSSTKFWSAKTSSVSASSCCSVSEDATELTQMLKKNVNTSESFEIILIFLKRKYFGSELIFERKLEK